MPHARAVAVIVLLFASGAVGARQPAVRASVPLPASASAIAEALGLSNDDRSLLLLDVIRRLYDVPEGASEQEAMVRGRLTELFRAAPARASVPLPLGPDAWRRTLLERPASDSELVAEILFNRPTALLYYGLAALDEETLDWLARDRETLQHLRESPGVFAAFGRSVRVRGERIVVPGGSEAEPIWREIVADPAKPGTFVRRLFGADKGRLAFFYDTIAHLDAPRVRFALGGSAMSAERADALADVFRGFAREWDIEARPFTRPQLDPSITLSTVAVTADGKPVAPASLALWDRVFRDDNEDIAFADRATSRPERLSDPPIGAAWLAARIHFEPYNVARRRLESVLFAQRTLRAAQAEPRDAVTILRALSAMPALVRTLERIGVRDVPSFLAAARHAHALNGISEEERRRTAVMQFQALVALIDRAVWSRGLSGEQAVPLLASLSALPVSSRGYDGRIADWIPDTLLALAPAVEATDPFEDQMLALVAGVVGKVPRPIVEWEGRRYRVDFAAADLSRLRRIREQQEMPALDAAVRRVRAARRAGGRESDRAERALAQTLASILYAAHLGPPEGPALSGGDVALRHELDVSSALTRVRAAAAWRLPIEVFGQRGGWRVVGALLGLDVALRRLTLRRLDPTVLPPGPRLPLLDRQALMLTVAFFNPHTLTDEGRDAIAAAMARGRARAVRLALDRDAVDDVARDAGLSEWRREALRWAIAQSRDDAAVHFSPLELFWLGQPVTNVDAWGGAMTPLTGCLCLEMPARRAWEELAGRRASGVLGTRGADVALQVADALEALKMPAPLAAGVLGFAMQDVTDDAQAGYFSDWAAFGRAVQRLSRDRIVDYIAALTADGPLVPAAPGGLR